MDKFVSVFEAAHKGDFEYVRTKLDENPNLISEKDSVSTFPFQYTKFVKYLILE